MKLALLLLQISITKTLIVLSFILNESMNFNELSYKIIAVAVDFHTQLARG